MPHRCHTWTIQWYSPGGARLQCASNLIHVSLGLPESTIQTASRSVQPFLHSSRQSLLLLSPKNSPLTWGDLDPLGPNKVYTPNGVAIGLTFLHGHRTWMVQWYLPGCANVHPHVTQASLGPPESTTQKASRSIQPFLHGSQLWQNRQTDRPTNDNNNRPHLRLVAWSSDRTSVFSRRAFAVLRSTCSWWVTT